MLHVYKWMGLQKETIAIEIALIVVWSMRQNVSCILQLYGVYMCGLWVTSSYVAVTVS